jgi:hypothetical protein
VQAGVPYRPAKIAVAVTEVMLVVAFVTPIAIFQAGRQRRIFARGTRPYARYFGNVGRTAGDGGG